MAFAGTLGRILPTEAAPDLYDPPTDANELMIPVHNRMPVILHLVTSTAG
jgi:hypothetical protein